MNNNSSANSSSSSSSATSVVHFPPSSASSSSAHRTSSSKGEQSAISAATTETATAQNGCTSLFQHPLFQQQQQQSNGHVPQAHSALIQPVINSFPAVSASSSLPPPPMGPFPGGSEAMQAFAAAAAVNNLGLLCAPSAAASSNSSQFGPTGPFSSLATAYGGHRPSPITQQQINLTQRHLPANAAIGGTAARKNSALSTHCSASSVPSSASASSINRSQRCGVCRGCQCKPCGQCTYCQDSPQFGGPGVKKQSCIERRCLRVLENRLQRDAPTFKARIGCNACEDCRAPNCQLCLVCLDKRFFNGRYMCGALCAKKRCNNATSLELPCALERTSLKRPSSSGHHQQNGGTAVPSTHHHQQTVISKRQLVNGPLLMAPTANSAASNLNSNIARILSAAQHDGRTMAPLGGGGGAGNGFGRSSGGSSSTTNSPMSESGAGSGIACSSAADTPPSASLPPLPSSAQQMLFRPLWPSAPSSATAPSVFVPFGVPYSVTAFDQQMASLAAAAAVGFPSVTAQQSANFHGCPSGYYPQKLLNSNVPVAYPKYEYFEENANGNCASEQQQTIGGVRQSQQQQTQQNGNEGGANPFVPPSYSTERKVVLQPL